MKTTWTHGIEVELENYQIINNSNLAEAALLQHRQGPSQTEVVPHLLGIRISAIKTIGAKRSWYEQTSGTNCHAQILAAALNAAVTMNDALHTTTGHWQSEIRNTLGGGIRL